MLSNDCPAYFPGEYVVIVKETLQLGRIVEPFERNIQSGDNLSYTVLLIKSQQKLDFTISNILPFNSLAKRGLPYPTSSFRYFFDDFIQQFYDNFNSIRETIFIPNIPHPLGNFIKEDKNCRDFLAAIIPSSHDIKNRLNVLENIQLPNKNFFQKEIKPQKGFQISQNKIVSMGDVISLNKQYFLVKRIFAIKRKPFDNVFLEVEVLANNQSDKLTLVGVSLEIPLIYDFQVFNTKLRIEDNEKRILLPLQFYNGQYNPDNTDKLIIDYLTPTEQQDFAQLITTIKSNKTQLSVQFEVNQFDIDSVFDRDNLPEFRPQDESQEIPENAQFLSTKLNQFLLTTKPLTTYKCQICDEEISPDLVYVEIPEPTENYNALAFFLNKFGGAYHCLECKSHYHQNCIFQKFSAQQTQFNELVCSGYPICGLNTTCQNCVGQKQNYFVQGENNFWQDFFVKNYHTQEKYDLQGQILDHFEDKNLVLQYNNLMNNWHMHKIEQEFIVKADQEIFNSLMSVQINSKSQSDCEILFGQPKAYPLQLKPQLVQNMHYTQMFLVEFMACIDSFLNKQTNLLFWLQVWYEENDFVELEQIDADKIQQVIIQRIKGEPVQRIPPKSKKADQVKIEPIQQLIIPTIDFTEKLVQENQKRKELIAIDICSGLNSQFTIQQNKHSGGIIQPTVEVQVQPTVEVIISPQQEQNPKQENIIKETPQKVVQVDPKVVQQRQPEIAPTQPISLQTPIQINKIEVQTIIDESGQLSNQQYAKIYTEVKEQFEQKLNQEVDLSQQLPILVPPQHQKSNKITQPFEVEPIAIKTGIDHTLNALSQSPIQDFIAQVTSGQAPDYQKMYQEPAQKMHLQTDTELTQSLLQNSDKITINSISKLTQTLAELRKNLPLHKQTYQQIMPSFPASATLQKLLFRNQILELEAQAETLSIKDNTLNLKANDTISTIEAIRTAFSELTGKLTLLSQELFESQSEKQQIQAQLAVNAQKQQVLAKKFCEIGKDVDQAVFSDFVQIQKLQQQIMNVVQQSFK